MKMSRRIGAALPTAAAVAVFAAAQATAQAQVSSSAATLRVLTPRAGEAIGANNFNLDVEFKSRAKSPVVTAELWVDGVRWVRRNLDAPRLKSTLSFDVDATTLSSGTHEVTVRVFTADGASSEVKLPVVAGRDEATTERAGYGAPDLAFAGITNGKRVSGTVDLTLDAKATTGSENPYVTIYIDNQFKTLKNYPPYSYTWDTTQVPNGYHTIEATGYTDAANGSVKRRLKVYVDNPGGNTVRMGDIPDLSNARRDTEGAAATTTAAAVASGRTLTIPTPTAIKPAAPTLIPPVGEAKLAAIAAPRLETAAPTTLGLTAEKASAAATVSRAADVKLAAPLGAAVAAKSAAAAVSAPLAEEAEPVAAAPTLAAPRLAAPKAPAVIAAPVRRSAPAPAPAALVPLRGGDAHLRTSPVAPRAAAAPAVKPRRTATIEPFLKTPAQITKGIKVAFDGQQIAFDVQPRVEAGLPLAPFRQIFEHTGGQVTWASDTHTLRAVNADTEVTIPVGAGTATVNGERVSLDRPAFIERGRTIVPLSFVGRALDVDVHYDPQTGRLQITSKK
jgi:hypothetical protein